MIVSALAIVAISLTLALVREHLRHYMHPREPIDLLAKARGMLRELNRGT